MPSMENPTHYARSIGIAEPKYDAFFRYVGADWLDAEDGDVESPFGYVGLVLVDSDLIDSVNSDYVEDFPALGWYIIRLNDAGLIWGIAYGDEESARADFTELEHAYSEWLDAEEEN